MTRLVTAFLPAVVVAALAAPAPADDSKLQAARKDVEALQGVWKVKSLTQAGKEAPEPGEFTVTIRGRRVTTTDWPADLRPGTFRLDPSQDPRQFDQEVGTTEEWFLLRGDTWRGIYRLDGQTLTVGLPLKAWKRPAEFKTDTGENLVFVLERVSAAPPAPAPSAAVEQQAAELLRIGRAFLRGKTPEAGRKRLAQVVEEYPGTKAAREAAELLPSGTAVGADPLLKSDPTGLLEREGDEMLRLGRAFLNGKNQEMARKILAQVGLEFPGTKAAKEAAELLKNLK